MYWKEMLDFDHGIYQDEQQRSLIDNNDRLEFDHTKVTFQQFLINRIFILLRLITDDSTCSVSHDCFIQWNTLISIFDMWICSSLNPTNHSHLVFSFSFISIHRVMFEFDAHFRWYTRRQLDVRLFFLLDYTNSDWLCIESIYQQWDISVDVPLSLMLYL